MLRVARFLIIAAALSACEQQIPESERIPLGQAPVASAETITGELLERIAASPYTYLRLKTPSGETWAAVPESNAAVGSQVTVYNPILMKGFESASLKRTFDEVYFGTLDAGAAAPAAAGGDPHAGVATPGSAVKVGKVDKATGPDARTVAEIWEQKGSLEGKTVTLRGVVVKTNNGVMGRNFIHLQDGSGDSGKGTHDITVTSQATVADGETVTIRGTVRTNKDFGAGYTYPVIIEEATVVTAPPRSDP